MLLLKRTIQQRLENALVAELLAGKFNDGDKIKINADNHKFTFEKLETPKREFCRNTVDYGE